MGDDDESSSSSSSSYSGYNSTSSYSRLLEGAVATLKNSFDYTRETREVRSGECWREERKTN